MPNIIKLSTKHFAWPNSACCTSLLLILLIALLLIVSFGRRRRFSVERHDVVLAEKRRQPLPCEMRWKHHDSDSLTTSAQSYSLHGAVRHIQFGTTKTAKNCGDTTGYSWATPNHRSHCGKKEKRLQRKNFNHFELVHILQGHVIFFSRYYYFSCTSNTKVSSR